MGVKAGYLEKDRIGDHCLVRHRWLYQHCMNLVIRERIMGDFN